METILEVGFGCLLLGFILGYSFGSRKRVAKQPSVLQPCLKSAGNFICHLPRFHISACDWQCQAACNGSAAKRAGLDIYAWHFPLDYCKFLVGHLGEHEWNCK